jgi:hypothetical protein
MDAFWIIFALVWVGAVLLNFIRWYTQDYRKMKAAVEALTEDDKEDTNGAEC